MLQVCRFSHVNREASRLKTALYRGVKAERRWVEAGSGTVHDDGAL